jgi:hypothetical protein
MPIVKKSESHQTLFRDFTVVSKHWNRAPLGRKAYQTLIVITALVISFFVTGLSVSDGNQLMYKNDSLNSILGKSEDVWSFGGGIPGSTNPNSQNVNELNEALSEMGISVVPFLLMQLRSQCLDRADSIRAWVEKRLFDTDIASRSESRRRRSIYTLFQLTKLRPDLAAEISGHILTYLSERLSDRNSRAGNSHGSESWSQMWLCWILCETRAQGHDSKALPLLKTLASEGTSVSRAAKAALRQISSHPEIVSSEE